MRTIIAIVGKSESGKTRLIEKLIPEIKKRGRRVGTVKHAPHGMCMDHGGKDSDRHRQAGSDTTVVAAPGEIMMFKRAPSDQLDVLAPLFADVDLVLAEGYKRSDRPKIEVFRKAAHDRPLALNSDRIAVVTDDDPSGIPPTVPRFGTAQISELADFIVRFCEKEPAGK